MPINERGEFVRERSVGDTVSPPRSQDGATPRTSTGMHPAVVAGMVIAAFVVLLLASQGGGTNSSIDLTSRGTVATTAPPTVTVPQPTAPVAPPTTRSDSQPAQPPAVSDIEPTAISVQIHSEPVGAVVHIDDRFVGTAPVTATFSGNDIGRRHAVSLGGDGFDTTRYWFVPGELRERELRLSVRTAAPPIPRTGTISIQLPMAMEVSIDGRNLGQSDVFRTELSPGEHRVEFAGSGVYVPPRDIRVRGGEVHTLTIGQLHSVRLVANPRNCEVWVGGQRFDATPTTFIAPEGDYQVEFRWPVTGLRQTVSLRMPAATNPFGVSAPK